MGENRRATIEGVDSATQLLHVRYSDWGQGQQPPPRPFLGGTTSGFHSTPQVGDQVVVIHGQHGQPLTTVSALRVAGATLPTLQPGESAIYHPDGRVLSYVKSDGTTTMWSKPGKPSTTVDANGVWNLGGVAGVATLDANNHVQQQAVYDATEAQSNDTLSSTSTIINNLNRIRYQIGQLVGGAWNAATAMIPLSQKAAAGGVASLDASSHVVQQPVYDATEAATNDTLTATSTVVNNLDRIRYQEQQIQGTTHWNDAPPATLQDVAAAMGTFPNAQRAPNLAGSISPTHGVDASGWMALVRDRYLAISSGSAGYVDLYDVGNPGSPVALTSINAAAPQSLAATTVGALVPFDGGKDLLLSYGKSGAQAGTNGGLQLWSMPEPGVAPVNLWYSDQGASLTGPICTSGPVVYQQRGAYPGTSWAGYAVGGETLFLGPTSGMTGYPAALDAAAQNERVYVVGASTVAVATMTLSTATLTRTSSVVSGLYDVCGVALSGQGYLLCADNDGTTLNVVNVANDSAPVRLGWAGGSTATANTGRRGVAAFGQYAAVCNGPSNRVDIYSIKVPTAPVLLTSLALPANANPRGLRVLGGNYLAVTLPGVNAVYIFNLWGLDAATARVGSLRAGQAQVAHDLAVVGRAQFGSGVDVSGGLNVEGPIGGTPVKGVRQVAVAMPSTASDILLSSAYQGGSFQSSSASPTFGPAPIPNFTAVTLVTTGGTVLVRLSGTLFNTQASTADWVKFGVQPDGAPGSNLFIGGNNSIPAQTYWSFSFSAPFTGLAAGTHTFVPVYQAGGPGGVNYLQFRLNSSPQVADALSFEVWEYA